eukprot:7386840-Prymnesium_polylepis.2
MAVTAAAAKTRGSGVRKRGRQPTESRSSPLHACRVLQSDGRVGCGGQRHACRWRPRDAVGARVVWRHATRAGACAHDTGAAMLTLARCQLAGPLRPGCSGCRSPALAAPRRSWQWRAQSLTGRPDPGRYPAAPCPAGGSRCSARCR